MNRDEQIEGELARVRRGGAERYHVKNREQLMRDARMVVDEGTITSHIKRLRRKLGLRCAQIH